MTKDLDLTPYFLGDEEERIYFPQKRGEALFLSRKQRFKSDSSEGMCYSDGFWVFYSESGVCGIIPTDLEVSVDGRSVKSLSVVRHGQVLVCQGEVFKFRQIFKRTPLSHDQSCTYCRGSGDLDAEMIYCPLCKTPYHIDCWDTLVEDKVPCLCRHCKFVPEETGKIFYDGERASSP